MYFNACSVKHINVLLRCSLVVTAVALLRCLLRSALLRKSVNEPLGALVAESVFNYEFNCWLTDKNETQLQADCNSLHF